MFYDFITKYTQIFCWKNKRSFCTFSNFFDKKYWHICYINVWNFNETLTNNVVSFEQPGPDSYDTYFFGVCAPESSFYKSGRKQAVLIYQVHRLRVSLFLHKITCFSSRLICSMHDLLTKSLVKDSLSFVADIKQVFSVKNVCSFCCAKALFLANLHCFCV